MEIQVNKLRELMTLMKPVVPRKSTLKVAGSIRVLSIRIEKKVNYFYEVTTSD